MDVFEVDLLTKSMKGDRNAFEAFINTYSKQVYNILYRVLGNEEDARDVSQEVFIKAYKKLHTFQGKSEIFTWLYRITMNSAKDFTKKKKPDFSLEESKDRGYEVAEDDSSNPERAFVNIERKDLLRRGLMELKEEQREIIVLRDIQGLSYEEISQILGIGLGTVKSRISRARMKLREILTQTPYCWFEREE